jgi:hypothetical protein
VLLAPPDTKVSIDTIVQSICLGATGVIALVFASNDQRRIDMKIASFGKPFQCLLVFSLAGAHAVSAAEVAPVGDAQVQARLLLTGKSFGVSGSTSRSAAPVLSTSTSGVLDAQVQARRMILGQEHVHSTVAGVTASGPCTTTAACDRNVREDALEMARRMILGSESVAGPKTRQFKFVKGR